MLLVHSGCDVDVFALQVKVSEKTIVIVSKAPRTQWSATVLSKFEHPVTSIGITIIGGSHQTMTTEGTSWADISSLHDAKDVPAFYTPAGFVVIHLTSLLL